MNYSVYKMDLTDIIRTCNSNATDYVFLSSVPGMESKINHFLGNKVSLKYIGKLKLLPAFYLIIL